MLLVSRQVPSRVSPSTCGIEDDNPRGIEQRIPPSVDPPGHPGPGAHGDFLIRGPGGVLRCATEGVVFLLLVLAGLIRAGLVRALFDQKFVGGHDALEPRSGSLVAGVLVCEVGEAVRLLSRGWLPHRFVTLN